VTFKIIINCGACRDFIGRCLASVRAQTFANWDAYVTVDPCGDDTSARAVLAAAGDPRIHVRANHTRRYSMGNLVAAVRRCGAAPEDVIVSLDGDDWFARDDSLEIIADAYEQFDCWVTYGSWLSVKLAPNGKPNGRWPAYPEGTVDFRGHPFLGTAVRTWKRWLWDHVRDDDLRNDAGEYVRVSEDKLVMIPLLELSGTPRAHHIDAPIMIYNKIVDYTIGDPFAEERERNAALIQRRPRYERLTRKAYAACGRHGRLIAGRPLFASPDERQNAGADDRHLAVIDLLHAPAPDQKA